MHMLSSEQVHSHMHTQIKYGDMITDHTHTRADVQMNTQKKNSKIILLLFLVYQIFVLLLLPTHSICLITSGCSYSAYNSSSLSTRSVIDCAQQIMAKDGVKGFFRGFTPAMVRSFPANATCFLGYEYSKAFLNKHM